MQAFVTYYRVSTQMQGRSGLGLEAQRNAVAQHTSGGTIIAEFTEIESGANNQRPQFELAKEAAKQSGAILVIAKLDRLSRDLHFITGFIKENIPFIACDIPHANKFTLHIMGAVAEQERDYISDRTKAAIAAKRERGQEWGTNRIRVEQADAFAQNIYRTIAELTDSGITSMSAIAKALNAAGVRTSKGGSWSVVQVQRIIARTGK